MAVLNDLFKVSYDRIGIQQLPCAVCSSAPYGIRFQIGGDEDIYLGDHRKPNGAYIENAVDRAMKIYSRLPEVPDILRVDDCPDLSVSGLPAPAERVGDSVYIGKLIESRCFCENCSGKL